MNKNKSYEEIFLQNSFLLENIQGGIVYSDFNPPFHLRYATEGMAKLSGYTASELTKMVQLDLVHEDDIPGLMADVERQFAAGDTFQIEYRLKCKDGTYVHVLDRAKVVTHEDGRKYIHCLLIDVSELKEMEQALRLNEEKYKIAIQQSGNVILEYNIITEILTFSENYTQLFGTPIPSGTRKAVIQNGWTDQAYENKLFDLFDEVVETATTCSMELLVHTDEKQSIWCSLYLIPVMDKGKLHSVIGCLKNIDKEKSQLEYLTELSLKDSLTGVYNRYAVEKLSNHQIECLKDTELSALLILDIDHFKQINDENGHAYGDEVLIQLARTVSLILPSKSILGRLGGDEFLIFVTLEKKSANLEALAEKIVVGVKKHFETRLMKLTISVGAAWYSDLCKNFQELYRNADAALYETKKNTRDGYSIWRK